MFLQCYIFLRVPRSTSTRGIRAVLRPVRTGQEQSALGAFPSMDDEQDLIVATMCVGGLVYAFFVRTFDRDHSKFVCVLEEICQKR